MATFTGSEPAPPRGDFFTYVEERRDVDKFIFAMCNGNADVPPLLPLMAVVILINRVFRAE